MEVLIAEHQTKYPLPDQFPRTVLDRPAIAVVAKLLGQARDDPRPGFDLREQQPASVGADLSSIESAYHRPVSQGVKLCRTTDGLATGRNGKKTDRLQKTTG